MYQETSSVHVYQRTSIVESEISGQYMLSAENRAAAEGLPITTHSSASLAWIPSQESMLDSTFPSNNQVPARGVQFDEVTSTPLDYTVSKSTIATRPTPSNLFGYPESSVLETDSTICNDLDFMQHASRTLHQLPLSVSKFPPMFTYSPQLIRQPFATSNSVIMSSGSEVNTALSDWDISDSCRRLIFAVIRSYPRMIQRLETLPPFIHPISSDINYISSENTQVRLYTQATFTPLEPLTICIGISQIFVTRTSQSSEFLWRTVDSEIRRFRDEAHLFSREETLAAVQATLMYIIMRLVDTRPGYFLNNGDVFTTMSVSIVAVETGYTLSSSHWTPSLTVFHTLKALSKRFAHLCPGPFSTVDTSPIQPEWNDWVFDETRRRYEIAQMPPIFSIVAVFCYLVTIVVSPAAYDAIADPLAIPLPCSKALWEARSSDEWEKEYNLYYRGPEVAQHPFCTIGDLVAAQNRTKGGIATAYDQDALDRWHAGLDGLTMLLSSVVACT
ncbi:hypothetical protein F5884DRAFT_749527 [Xylogone sp. PMI_703]|nr:hypothetical protein F5884DRAFT_749527 [Xylogone sp. PMI_703]